MSYVAQSEIGKTAIISATMGAFAKHNLCLQPMQPLTKQR